ncbi:MAG: fumarylacetoacetate hydrolase family protein [Nitrospiraceae bacterium]|nr:MAG: fumarylacetoacetate hydrolase family protein [Nitrospiraceae bacterium]
MKLIRFGAPHKEKPGILLEDGSRVDVSSFGEDYTETFFETDGVSRLEKWLEHNRDNSSPGGFQQFPEIDGSVRLGPPVCRPGKIVCIGFNYLDHARESGKAIPPEPVFFLKSPSALSGPNDDVRLPRTSRKTDWEVELAVVVKKKAAYVQKDTVMDFIAGFVLFNDYSEREFQFNRGGQWVKGKSADTFAPLGPFLASPDEIRDHTNLNMWLKVNGEFRQESNTSNMIFDLPTIISSVSQYMTLLPGDILCTGTPAGVGYGRKPPEFLKKGDIVEYGIDGLGSASQSVIEYDDV